MISNLGNRAVYAAFFAVVGVGSVACLDVVADVTCLRLPLWLYLAGYSTGAVAGLFLGRWMSQKGTARGIVKCGLSIFTLCAALSFGYLVTSSPSEPFLGFPPSWNAKCAFAYCGRILGPGFDVSPYPVGVPSCGTLHMCANEYPFTSSQYLRLLTIINEQGCVAP